MSKKIRLGKRGGKNKLDLLGKAIDFPNDPFGRSAHITLRGNREAIIDGCYGIIEYSDCKIIINIGNKQLSIIGVDFDISDYSSTSLTVRGTIKNIDFS